MKPIVLLLTLFFALAGLARAQTDSLQSSAATPPTGSSKFSLADLRDDSTTAQPAPLSAATPDDDERERSSETGIRLSDIPLQRDRIALENAHVELERKKQSLDLLCSCSSERAGCYDNSYGAIKSDILRLEDQRLDQCNKLQKQVSLLDMTPPTIEEARVAITALDRRRETLRLYDAQADTLIADAEKEHQRRVAQARQPDNDSSSFQWGKLAALGAGALAGGLTELDVEDQVAFVGAMVQDSTAGTDGMGNMRAQAGNAVASNTASTGHSGTGHSSSTRTVPGAHALACNLVSQSMCVEYTLGSQSTYDQFLAQCRQAGAEIHSQCPVSGPACRIESENRTSVTITPGTDPATVRDLCAASGGTFSFH
ncbi:hypothetical protein [Marinobacter sp. 2_MG-2023]|uniref:hypothetical protein n=1 Tax=Marinobacter sp. 2_MG-2023 TaxID=3062679 RepID=UPI0026E44CA9|nr:hypothetical protein [Marinobacter sp. 2_MG-2023]MDO6442825.1 hypothetical protein [Marinobacter sp. 2_MG-2023]